MDKQIKQKAKRIFAAMLALTITAGTLPYTPLSDVFEDMSITASAASNVYLTDYLTVSSSGTATGYFTYSDHFYKIEWSGINTSETTSVRLFINNTYNQLRCRRMVILLHILICMQVLQILITGNYRI